MTPTDFAPFDRMGTAWSAITAYIVAGLIPAAILFLFILRVMHHLKRAAIAKKTMEEAEARSRGDGADAFGDPAEGHVVLAGTVETDPPELAAIVVSIEQHGRQYQTKNGTRHVWTETSREVVTRPFTITLASGTRVHVTPTEEVALVDGLDETIRTDRSVPVRTRRAKLEHGEHAFITGVLRRERDAKAAGGGYRDAGTALVLHRAKGERMMISTKPLDERHRSWARYYGVWALVLGVALAVVQGAAFRSFHHLNIDGKIVTATVSRKDTYITRSKNSTTTHYRVYANFTDSAGTHPLVDDTNRDAWNGLKTGSPIPFVVAGTPPTAYQIGTVPGVSLAALILTLTMAFVPVLLFFTLRQQRRAWWEQKKVTEHGSGPLV